MIGSRLEDLVSRQAARTPDADALVFGDAKLSYRDLDSQSNRLGRLLTSIGCCPGDRVCLFMPKGIDAIIGMLGVLKAGAMYVPMDLESPAARVRRIIDACDPKAVLAAPEGSRLLDELFAQPEFDTHVVAAAPEPLTGKHFATTIGYSELPKFSAEKPRPDVVHTGPAHILFTSGSTGMPKGVVITHENIIAFVNWATEYFGIGPGERISGHPPLHFDLSTFDIFGTLTRGATLYLVPPQLNLLAPKLAQWIRTSRLTQWFSVPSVLTYMTNFDVVRENDFPDMKRLLWCGEVLPTPTLIYWMRRLPHVSFTNLYGPTEATIASSYYTVEHCPTDEKADIPIGTACSGEELLLLDEQMQHTVGNNIGDLYIRGAGLSLGYWRDEEKTTAAFVQNPGSRDRTDRIYRTGDLGRRDDNGLFRYVGRADSQIKSRGHRIELGEVETALNALGCARECAVVGANMGGFEGVAICCAYVPMEDADITPVSLRRNLSSLLPRYMLPAHWKEFEALPKNANGKIDRSKIRELFECDVAVDAEGSAQNPT